MKLVPANLATDFCGRLCLELPLACASMQKTRHGEVFTVGRKRQIDAQTTPGALDLPLIHEATDGTVRHR